MTNSVEAPRQGTRALRWEQATADGLLVDRPGRLYCARLVPGDAASKEMVAVVRDGTAATAPAVLALAVVGGAPDDWPLTPVSLPFLKGLYVTFVGAGTARLLVVGWDLD